MSQDSTNNTIADVANGGSPQPVKIQESVPTSKEEIAKATDEMFTSEDEALEASEQTVEDAAISAAEAKGDISKKEAQELRKKLKLKVDGEEFEEEIDFNDEESLKKHLQKSKAFDKRLKEFSSYKNNVDKMIKLLQDDPESFLEQAGLNVDEFAEKRLKKAVENMKKSPEQLANEKMQKELEDLKKRLKEEEDSKQQQEMERLRNEQAAAVQSEIETALESGKTKLPKKNPFVIQKIAQNMVLAMKNGYPNVTAMDVLPIVEKQWKEELRSYFDASTEDIMEDLVGRTNLDRYRKQRISAARKAASQTQTAKQAVQDTGITRKEEPKKEQKTFKKMFSYIDE